MTQHYMTDGRATESICGYDMVGLRNPDRDTNPWVTDCISCNAIINNRPLYAVRCTDEDGYTQTVRFNTPREQMEYVEFCFDEGAANVTMLILSVDDLKSGE